MKDNPLGNIIEFTGQKCWVARTSQVMNELQGSLSDYEAFSECYLVFSPRNITPANRKDYEQTLKANIVDKLAEVLVMLDGLSVILGEEVVEKAVNKKGKEIFSRYEEELTNCMTVAKYMYDFGKNLNARNTESE